MAKCICASLGLLVLDLGTVYANVLKGFAYAPVPLKYSGYIPGDDFTDYRCATMWSDSAFGAPGRADLTVMKETGANVVRLYGNDPRTNKEPFLREAAKNGLEVIMGMSDYPYLQMTGACAVTGYDCFTQIKDQYLMMLGNGMTEVRGGRRVYNQALHSMNIVNEPELKFGISTTKHWVRAIMSALDGMLDAEKAFAVQNPQLRMTVTWSTAVCSACATHGKDPAVGQMMELERAMLDPVAYGYVPRNPITQAYQTRWINSFNTAAPAMSVEKEVLVPYKQAFGNKPVFISEYHCYGVSQTKDVEEIMVLAQNQENPLQGVMFFEFQKRYDKGGTEQLFGVFGLGPERVGTVRMGDSWMEYPVWCLNPISDIQDPHSMVYHAITGAFRGPGVAPSRLCTRLTSNETSIVV